MQSLSKGHFTHEHMFGIMFSLEVLLEMKLIMKNVDMICISTKDGVISPIKFRMTDKRGDIIIVKIDLILERSEQRIAGNRMLIYKVQSVIANMEKVYEMKYEIATCKWYLSKI